MAIFHTGGQLGAVGAAVMCAAADQAPGFIDAETGEDMEESLTAEEVKQGILSGKYVAWRDCFLPHNAPFPAKLRSTHPTFVLVFFFSRRYKPCTQEHIYHLFPPKDKQ